MRISIEVGRWYVRVGVRIGPATPGARAAELEDDNRWLHERLVRAQEINSRLVELNERILRAGASGHYELVRSEESRAS